MDVSVFECEASWLALEPAFIICGLIDDASQAFLVSGDQTLYAEATDGNTVDLVEQSFTPGAYYTIILVSLASNQVLSSAIASKMTDDLIFLFLLLRR